MYILGFIFVLMLLFALALSIIGLIKIMFFDMRRDNLNNLKRESQPEGGEG